MRLSRSLLVGASFIGAFASPAFAQTAPAPADDAATAQDAADEVTDEGNDIIVTASKREATLQDTPIAVSVTTAETISQAQVRDLLDVQTLVPSLRVSQLQSSANTNFIIRGFGNGANNAGIEPSVGVFIDGVYRSRSAAQIGDLPNLRRIEVLRGPQSTLFGKNASAGIISIVTAEPTFTPSGGVELSYGNYNAFIAKADFSGPITDTIAFSVAGNYNRRDGYARDIALNTDVNDRNRFGFRTQILWEPSDTFKVRLIGDYDNIDENCCIAANVVNGPTGAIVNALAGGVGLDAQNPFSYNVYNNFLSSNKIENYGGSAQVDYELGALSLTSITAYREVRSDTNQDSDFTSADLIGNNTQNQGIHTFTQEVRLASDFDGPLNFIVGGYYFNEDIQQRNAILFGNAFRGYGDQLIRAASGGALTVATLESTFGALEGAPTRYVNSFFRSGDGLRETYSLHDEAFSFFGTLDFDVTDRLRLTGGINYTNDAKDFSANANSSDVFSSIDLDAPQYAPFRNQLLYQGALAQQVGSALNLGRSATAAEIGAFAGAQPAIFGQINAGSQAFATANQNNPAANPLGGLRAFQFLPQFLGLPNVVEPGQTRDDNVSWNVRAAYELTDDVNIYFTYATGFKASSINLSRDSRPRLADRTALQSAGLTRVNQSYGSRFAGPENSSVYEGGIKAQFDHVAFNVAVFQQTVRGFQSNTFTGTGFALNNAGSQSAFGIEFDGSVTPVRPITVTLAFTYLKPRYDSYVNTGIFVNGRQLDLSGSTPAGIPEISMSLGGTYTADIGNDNKLVFRMDYSYESQVQIVDAIPNITREVNNLNTAIVLSLNNGFEFSLWGRNVLNNQYLTTIFPSVAQSGSVSGYPSQPRTYGIAAKFRF